MSPGRVHLRRPLLWLAWLVVTLLVCLPQLRERSPAARGGLAPRLLGPISSLAADLQWARAGLALRRGQVSLGLARAETALALDPSSPGGWQFLAWYQAFDCASQIREPDPRRRLAWVRAALDTTTRGEAACSRPEELAFLAGLILSLRPALDAELSWPGGPAAAWEEARRAFERAAALGHPRGADFAASAREELARLRR